MTFTSSDNSISKAAAILSRVSIEGELVPRSIAPKEFLLKSDNSASFSWETFFNFLNSLDFVDLVTFGVGSVDELKKDMEVLKGI